MKTPQELRTTLNQISQAAGSYLGSAVLSLLILVLLGSGCAITATRPVQEMADTAAAIRAAKEVQADVKSPDLFRQANEWFFKARRNYRFKNFKQAHDQAMTARGFAEQAEFESVRNGAQRDGNNEIDPYSPVPGEPAPKPEPTPSFSPYAYPQPEPTLAKPLEDAPPPTQAGPAPIPTPSGTPPPR